MSYNIYDVLKELYRPEEDIKSIISSEKWTAVETPSNLGISMTVQGCDSAYFASLNAYFNRGTDNYLPLSTYYTTGLDFMGKTVGVVGHLGDVKKNHGTEAKKIYFFELEPKEVDDLPAEMEEELLPSCDIAIITGSALVNGTLPHLLELCENAHTILTGPSVPKCKELLDFGIDRLAGMCVRDIPKMKEKILKDIKGSPYVYGDPFVLKK